MRMHNMLDTNLEADDFNSAPINRTSASTALTISTCAQNRSTYRQWFHNTVSRTHYSLGEVTETYDQWLTHHTYGPNPTRTQSLTNPPPTAPTQPTTTNTHRQHYLPSYIPPLHPTRPSHVPPPRSPVYPHRGDGEGPRG